MNTPLPQERWVYTTVDVEAPTIEEAATDGFKRRTKTGPYTGFVVEDYIADGDAAPSKLQPTGETVTFYNYWNGEVVAGNLIYVRQDPNDGVYKVFGGEC